MPVLGLFLLPFRLTGDDLRRNFDAAFRQLSHDALPFFSAAFGPAFSAAFRKALRQAFCQAFRPGCRLYLLLVLFPLRQCPKYQSNAPFNDKYQSAIGECPQWGQRSGEVEVCTVIPTPSSGRHR